MLVITHSFPTAAENMKFDETLVGSTTPRLFRIYRWQKAGITYGHSQSPSQELSGFDASSRITGGGLVFHSPGDLVFSWAGSVHDILFGKRVKEKLVWASEFFITAFSRLDIPLYRAAQPEKELNLTFCHTYFSPYELYFGKEKIVALSLRKFRDRFLIQGIIHLFSNKESFGSVPQYAPYWSEGLAGIQPGKENAIQDFLVLASKTICTASS